MKSLKLFYVVFVTILLVGCGERIDIPQDLRLEYPESFSVTITNPSDIRRDDAVIILDVDKLKEKAPLFNPLAFVLWLKDQELASQAVDSDGDGGIEHIVTVGNFEARESKKLLILYIQAGQKERMYPKRTQAELSRKTGGRFKNRKYIGGEFQNVNFLELPPEHTDHSEFIRYEGPGWESDKVGYRFYLDWRNAIDIFGKKVTTPVLQDVGQDGYDSYHEMADWGMDILKVGESLGIGTIAMWHEGRAQRVAETGRVSCAILSNGPVYSQIRTQYFDWKVGSGKYNLTSDLSITAGSRMTRHTLKIDGHPDNLCTGLAKHEAAHIIPSKQHDETWAYLALWGKQSLAEDQLGTAILYRTEDLIEITEDEYNHAVVLKPSMGELTYYFLAAWEKEPGGIQTEESFKQYLETTLTKLNEPVRISY